MAKKEGINTLQRLMNVVFIVWALWFLFVIILALSSGGRLQIDLLNIARYPLMHFNTFLGWLPIMVVNYIFNKKATVWNKDS
jgi:hypothetical protein